MDTVELAKHIRLDSLRMVHRAKASHIGSALSIADILAVLYGEVMRPDDTFILSKGHATVALYAALKHTGHDLDLGTYGQNDSPLMHHVSHKVPGVKFSTGSLGHGLPFGLGIAMAKQRFNQGQGRVFVLLSDGEMQEGSNWEAIQFAAHHNVHNLVAIVDSNGLQSMKTVTKTLEIEPLCQKVEAFGWHTDHADGHNHKNLLFNLARLHPNHPTFIQAMTVKGKGVSFMENQVDWHYRYPNEDELKQAIAEVHLA